VTKGGQATDDLEIEVEAAELWIASPTLEHDVEVYLAGGLEGGDPSRKRLIIYAWCPRESRKSRLAT